MGAAWGVGGVFLLIGSATYRLGHVGIAAFDYTLGPRHWVFLALFLAFMLGSEGYRGFQKGFAPRVAARARHLQRHPRVTHALFAPLFCMGFFHATRRRQLTSIGVTSMIVGFILIVRKLPQPWHSLVDVGVAAGLVWGLVALVGFTYAAFTSETFGHAADVPG